MGRNAAPTAFIRLHHVHPDWLGWAGSAGHRELPRSYTAIGDVTHFVLQQKTPEYLKKLIRERNRIKRTAGHRSPKAQQLQVDIEISRNNIADTEMHLAGALSPIGDLPENNVRVYGATPVRAGITVVFPAASQQEVAGLMRNFRNGVRAAPKVNLLGDGAALVLFVVQVLNLVQVGKETFGTTRDQRVWMPLINAIAATGAAGFAAAQGVFDTALSARRALLAKGLQNYAVTNLYVQMGKLHIGLGWMTYGFGGLAAGVSLKSYHSSWELTVRSGHRNAQTGAAMSLVGAGGLLASNTYGLVNTLDAATTVLMAKKGSARTAAWAASGVRLSGVFFRANLAGALFTALELSGSYIYNYYNTTFHDQWLQTTPWGKNATKRQNLTLHEYQHALMKIVQSPVVQVGQIQQETWWENLLQRAKTGDIHLLLPCLAISAFVTQLGGKPSYQMFIGAYRITDIRLDRGQTTERWEILSEQIHARLRRLDDDQTVLCISYPETLERIIGKAGEALMLVIVLQNTKISGETNSHTYHIRLNPKGSGIFPSTDQTLPLPHAPLIEVNPVMLELTTHA